MSGKAQAHSYPAIDAVKFLMAVFVVAIHTDPLIHCDNRVIQTVYSCLLHSAVPFFFLSTGFLLAKKAEPAIDGLRSVIHRHLRKAIRLYTLWHIIYLPLAVYHYYTNDYTVIRGVLSTLRAYFLVGKSYGSDILWYLLSSIYALIFVSLLLKYRLRISQIVLCCVPVYLFGIFFNYIMGHAGRLPAIPRTIFELIELAFTTGRIFTGFLFIALGMLIAQKKPPLMLGLVLLVGGFIGNYRNGGFTGNIMVGIQSVGTFITVSHISLSDAPVYPYLRKTSTNLYFLHQWVMFAYTLLTGQPYRQGPDVFLVTFSVSMLLSCIWLYCQNRSRTKQ